MQIFVLPLLRPTLWQWIRPWQKRFWISGFSLFKLKRGRLKEGRSPNWRGRRIPRREGWSRWRRHLQKGHPHPHLRQVLQRGRRWLREFKGPGQDRRYKSATKAKPGLYMMVPVFALRGDGRWTREGTPLRRGRCRQLDGSRRRSSFGWRRSVRRKQKECFGRWRQARSWSRQDGRRQEAVG